MTTEQKERIDELICDMVSINVEELKDTDHFVNNLGFDSLDSLELISEDS